MREDCSFLTRHMTSRTAAVLFAFTLLLIVSGSALARQPWVSDGSFLQDTGATVANPLPSYRTGGAVAAAELPRRQQTTHNQNNMQMVITNNGAFGFATYYWSDVTVDPFSGEKLATVEYPRNSDIRYQMNGTLLLGAIVEGDTLVSMGLSEFYPEAGDLGDFTYRSIDVNHPKFDPEANSQLDIICEYLDTFVVFASPDLRPHEPLGIKVVQKSMSWTGDNIDDFILFDFEFQNIGQKSLRDVYVGFTAHGGVNYTGDFDHTLSQLDDAVGFLDVVPAPGNCNYEDTLNIAYQMDADGDPVGASWEYYSPRAVVGMRILDVPADDWRVNFNWSAELGPRGPRFSPRRRPGLTGPWREHLPHIMEPLKDAELYYYLANPEVDYDQLTVAVNKWTSGWLPPPASASKYTNSARPYYMISAGPFDLLRGDIQHVTLAVVGGEKVHVNPWDFPSLYRYYRPWPYLESLDFSRLAENARWAGWIYDNPGIDTDGDGYAGEFRVCGEDTTWYKGDGVPDYKADGPPQNPRLQVIPSEGKLIIRWNGFYSETTKDPFTNLRDFEGYRVYVGTDDRESALTLVSVYDRENYDRFRWTPLPDGSYRWENESIPFSLDSLRTIYRDPEFDPRQYTRLNPFTWNDSIYYFAPHSYNASSLCCLDGIHKVYPNATRPSNNPEEWSEDEVIYDYGEPLPKYYEYEFVHDDLLPTLSYWISVTSYDFGFAGGNIPSKEGDPLANMVMELAQTPVDTVQKYHLDVYVYPNPWKWDDNYQVRGWENRDGTGIPNREHRIHFANLPRVCKISIFSLDGDLIREIDHDYPDGGAGSMHDSWDLITRNTQAVESGLYYYVVESKDRTQIGKFVIIK
jgi:hypothetical protein